MIEVAVHGKIIHCSTMEERSLTYIMPLYCLKVIGSPQRSQSTMTLKAFDESKYNPCGILNYLQVELEGKTISVEVEDIDGP